MFSTGRAALRPKVLNRGQLASSKPLLGWRPLLQDSQNLSIIFQAAEGESDEVGKQGQEHLSKKSREVAT